MRPILFRIFLVSLFSASLMAKAAELDFATLGSTYGLSLAPAQTSVGCEDFLSGPRYADGQTFTPGRLVNSLKPEPGSIEDRHPGVIQALIATRLRVLEQRKLLPPSGEINPITEKIFINGVRQELEMIPNYYSDPRLGFLIEDFSWQLKKRIETAFDEGGERKVSRVDSLFQGLSANLWELIVACLFDGKIILLNRQVSWLYPEEFRRAAAETGQKKSLLDREIDIAIVMEDGSRRWIEVKDWNNASALTKYPQIISQFAGQDELRRRLRPEPLMLLVLKYGVDELIHQACRQNTCFDEMLFVFPRGLK